MTAADIVTRSLHMIGQQGLVTGSWPAFDGTPAGNAAGVLYQAAAELLMRQMNPDFARTRANLTVAAPIALVEPWPYAYLYPVTCLRLRQLAPQPGSYDKNDPKPIRGEVAFDTLAGRVILTTQSAAVGVFTTSAAGPGNEAVWDFGFQEAMVRLLANPMAMALSGRPDYARELLDESERFAQRAELTDEF